MPRSSSTTTTTTTTARGVTQNEKLKVMDQDGQTDKQRRELRMKQRSLAADIAANAADIEDANKAAFTEKRDANNKLFEEVNYAREAVMDSENLSMIAQRASKQALKLVSASTYDVDKVVKALRKKCSFENGGFNWTKLGRACGSCFNMVPFTQFLNGPLDKPDIIKEKVVREKRKRVDETAEEENPDEIVSQKQNKEGMSGMENIIKSVNKMIKEKCANEDKRAKIAKEPKKGVCAVKLLVNPKSFTQTAENMLALSFNVKQGGTRVANDADGLPVVDAVQQNLLMQTKQCIVSLSMKDWKRMVNSFEVKEGEGVPNRKISRGGRETFKRTSIGAGEDEEGEDED
jgi:hypothetical protein